ncbi:hypothetical protein [Nostoc sp. CCY0012]
MSAQKPDVTKVEAAIADLQPMLTENQATLTNRVTADLPLVSEC